MKKQFKDILSHPLISGSLIFSAGSFFFSILNYLFNLLMGRVLSVADYGVLIALTTTINILSIFAQSVITVFTKFSASLIGQNKGGAIRELFKKGTFWIAIFGFIISVIIFILRSTICQFFHIQETIYIDFVILIIFLSFMQSVGFGILQGLLRFGTYSIINIFITIIKLSLGLLFVYLGGRTLGALSAYLISAFIGYILIFIPLKKYLNQKDQFHLPYENLPNKLIIYGIPVFLSSIGVSGFMSVDVILVKHFYSANDAGLYSALSLMGRSIFYLLAPINYVLFPLVAQKKEKGENLSKILIMTLILTGLPTICLTIIYFIFPKLILTIFFPAPAYSGLITYLGPFSVFILFFTLASILNNFYLSIGKTRVFILTTIGLITEIIYILYFHNSFTQLITGLIVTSFLLLFGLLLYYPYATRKN
ncbi:MAG: oligosaccharide flippase family protein [Candidatus Gottesmanbacteria bacterium]